MKVGWEGTTIVIVQDQNGFIVGLVISSVPLVAWVKLRIVQGLASLLRLRIVLTEPKLQVTQVSLGSWAELGDVVKLTMLISISEVGLLVRVNYPEDFIPVHEVGIGIVWHMLPGVGEKPLVISVGFKLRSFPKTRVGKVTGCITSTSNRLQLN